MVVGINPVTVEWWWVALTRGLIRGVSMMAESLHTNTDGRHAHIWQKPLKNFFSRTGCPMILKLGMQNWDPSSTNFVYVETLG